MDRLSGFIGMAPKFCLLVFFLGIVACSGTRRNTAGDIEDYVWPLPPEQPRIKFVKSIHSEMDVGRKRSFAQRIFETIFGRVTLRALKKPLAVHTDRRGRVLVVDTGWRKVLVFDFDNNKVDFLGKGGRGRLLNPLGVTTDEKDNIYVSDAGGNRIMVYDAQGRFLTAFGGKEVLLRPAGIAVNPALNRIYVVDTWAHQVKAFDRDAGEQLLTIGKDENKPEDPKQLIEGALDMTWNRGSEEKEFRFPTYLTIAPDGKLYVVDTMNFRVQIFSPDGDFITAIGKIGNLPGNFYRPKGIGLDSDGNIYVADASFNNVQIFNQQGQLLLNFGTFGSGLADLRLPAGLFIDKQNQICVVDQFNHRVQIYQYLGDDLGKKENLTEKK